MEITAESHYIMTHIFIINHQRASNYWHDMVLDLLFPWRSRDRMLAFVLIASAGTCHFFLFMICLGRCLMLNTVTPDQNYRHFADGFSKCILSSGKFDVLFPMSPKFAPWGPIDSSPTLVQAMAWRWTGGKPLIEPMVIKFNDAKWLRCAPMR